MAVYVPSKSLHLEVPINSYIQETVMLVLIASPQGHCYSYAHSLEVDEA